MVERLLEAARRCAGGRRAYLVGGFVRDRLLGRPSTDLDLVVEGPVAAVARCLAARARGGAFALDREREIWRVVVDGFQLDVERLVGATIEEDLARRDLTVNAIALTLEEERLVDPLGGAGDLRAGLLRAPADTAFSADPLRVMRLARFACELGFRVEPRTAELARRAAPGLAAVSVERVFYELCRVLASARAVAGVELLDRLGALAVALPELGELKGVPQTRYHHLDVYGHTLEVLAYAAAFGRALAGEPLEGLAGAEQLEAFVAKLGRGVREELARALGAPLADRLTRLEALRFGALLHDIAKPRTRAANAESGVIFPGHDREGAVLAQEILARLHASTKLRDHVAGLVAHHLQLGFLVYRPEPLSPRNRFAYLRRCEPVGVDVTVLSVADRLATRGARAQEAIARHLDLAAELLPHALAWEREGPPRLPLRGDRLAEAVGIAPGPELGWLLEELRVAQYAGELGGAAAAVARARALLASKGVDP